MAGDSEDDRDQYDCSDDIDDVYAYDDDESLSDSFSDYETDNNHKRGIPYGMLGSHYYCMLVLCVLIVSYVCTFNVMCTV